MQPPWTGQNTNQQPQAPANPGFNFQLPTSPGQSWQSMYQGTLGSGRIADNPLMSFINQQFGPMLGGRIMSQLSFGNSLEPGRQGAIQGLLRTLQPGNVQNNAQNIRNRAFSGAVSQAPQRQSALASLGLGSGAQEGAIGASMDAGNQAANDYLGDVYSPQGQMGVLQAILMAMGAGQGSDLNQFLGLNQAAQGNRQQNLQEGAQSGGGLMGGLGGLLGNALGSAIPGGNLFGGLFGGGGGNPNGATGGWQIPI